MVENTPRLCVVYPYIQLGGVIAEPFGGSAAECCRGIVVCAGWRCEPAVTLAAGNYGN